MSTQYTTEPPPTATVLLHTTAGPLTISLFAAQTPLTSRNFLQHCLDGTYTNVLFHRIAPGFVVQTGDPSGTGEGGTAIYEDGDNNLERYGEDWGRLLRLPEEKYHDRIVLGDEFHSRLKFNRRGLVGMARMSDAKDGLGQYGSQFFITLGDCRAELDGKSTMFGRVEGEGIYNVMRIAEGERLEGTERAIYPEKIVRVEVVQMPEGKVWSDMKPRAKIAVRSIEKDDATEKKGTAQKRKNKAGKALLSFGDDEDSGVVIKPKKAKFNTALIDGSTSETTKATTLSGSSVKRKSPSPSRAAEPQAKRRKPSFHDSTTQLPLRDAESPSRSVSPVVADPPALPNRRRPSKHKSASTLEAEIAALKQSMRRDTTAVPVREEKKSALEAMIPANSTRGRRRPKAGESGSASDSKAMDLLNAFKSRLEKADQQGDSRSKSNSIDKNNGMNDNVRPGKAGNNDNEDEEAVLCDLHFIANCLSCSNWQDENTSTSKRDKRDQARNHTHETHGQTSDQDRRANENEDESQNEDEDDDKSFLAHSLTFEKDRLGKDLSWKRKNEEELVVIDPRAREREITGGNKKKGRRDRERIGASGTGTREWDRRGR